MPLVSSMDAAAMVARANEEREKLFQRYERGRSPGADIDPWEDPAFEVYHQTDRYGFIHDKRLPQRADPDETRARAVEMERVKKWLKMTARWEDKKTREVMRRRVFKGVPDKMRSRVWLRLLDVEPTMAANRGVYAQQLRLARAWSSEARQIDSDVNRQFREHWIYRERYGIKQQSLFNVLTAYSMYNSEVGYCQGMSGVAGVLLMYMGEEEAFWALSTILADRRFAMHGLYIEGFPKLTRFLAHHDVIVGKFMPKLKRHFDQYNLDSILYSLKWFFVIFIERIPFSLCLRVWDIYLLDGERVVTAMAYTILRLHKNKLLKLKDMDLIVQYIQTQLHKDFGYDDDYVIKMLEQSMDELRKAKLDLPPPASPIELPQKPFGVFVEPAFEAKVGIRKSIFSDTEKEVTDTVILRRELTVQELQESASATATELRTNASATSSQAHTSNGQLNSSSIVPESEDGGSLLGSSRKSLADTSVTSTADLSVFSTGPRSQHAFDICVDDVRSMRTDHGVGGGSAEAEFGGRDDGAVEAEVSGGGHGGDGDENGDLSPGSGFCSLSIVGRTPSAMMATPTPRAMSPHDVVRIYVPPAPPDEDPQSSPARHPPPMHPATAGATKRLPSSRSLSASQQSLQRIGGAQLVHNNNNNNTGESRESLYGRRPDNGDRTPTQQQWHSHSNHQDSRRPSAAAAAAAAASSASPYASQDLGPYAGATSSSRRGSLSRKSPSAQLLLQLADDEHQRLLSECAHMQPPPMASMSSSTTEGGHHLDRLQQQQRRRRRSATGSTSSSIENVSLVQTGSPAPKMAVPMMTSFEELALRRQMRELPQAAIERSKNNDTTDTGIEYQPLRHTQNGDDAGGGQPATGSVSDVVQSAYDRYYVAAAATPSPDAPANDDDDDDDEDDDDRRSSGESSTSPNSKSRLQTPVSEAQPLIATVAVGVRSAPPDMDDSDMSGLLDACTQSTASGMVTAGGSASRIPRKHSAPRSAAAAQTPSPPVARPSRIPLKHKHSTGNTSPEHAAVEMAPATVTAGIQHQRQRQRQQVPLAADARRPLPLPPSEKEARFGAVLAVHEVHSQRPHHHPQQQQQQHHHQVDMDSRIAAPLGGVYQFASAPSTAASPHQQQQQTSSMTSSAASIRKPAELNKIRIKINQGQRH